jgi:phosphoenolpyruvate carboxylase
MKRRMQKSRLWLTATGGTRLEAADEVNGLAYFRLTFLNELPRLYAELERALKARFGLPAEPRLPPFLTVGTWIGGDRDGNPYVDAAVMRGALAQQAALVLVHYLEETGHLYKELALRRAYARSRSEAFAARRANARTGAIGLPACMSGIHARLAAARVAGRRESQPPATWRGRLTQRRRISG